MRYINLTEAYSRQKTLDNYGDRLSKELSDEYNYSDHKTTPEQAIEHFEANDPTPKKAYVKHFIRWYLDGSLQRLEDTSKATKPLQLYNKFRLRDDVPDIATMTFDDLLDLGEKLASTASNSEISKSEEEEFYKNGSAQLLVNNDEWKVVIPKTEEASVYFGRNTRWCTAATETTNYFGYYNKQGKLYIILQKKLNKRWQFHFETSQFMDEKDHQISKEDKDEIGNKSGVFNCIDLSKDGLLIKHIPNPTFQQMKIAVKENALSLFYINDKTQIPKEIYKSISTEDSHRLLGLSDKRVHALYKAIEDDISKNQIIAYVAIEPSRWKNLQEKHQTKETNDAVYTRNKKIIFYSGFASDEKLADLLRNFSGSYISTVCDMIKERNEIMQENTLTVCLGYEPSTLFMYVNKSRNGKLKTVPITEEILLNVVDNNDYYLSSLGHIVRELADHPALTERVMKKYISECVELFFQIKSPSDDLKKWAYELFSERDIDPTKYRWQAKQ